MSVWRTGMAVALGCALAGCGGDEPAPKPTPRTGFDERAQDELEQAGLTKYFGRFTPAESTDIGESTVVYSFTPRDDGPTCIDGDPFRVSVRDAGSKDVLIYLQGGGACFGDRKTCNTTAGYGIQPVGWTDPDSERNPTLAGFNVVFVSYCDGSVFSGDHLVQAADGTIERRHRGVANLSAALDLARSLFPEPRRVVLVGSSAGGYGSILGTALTRLAYPARPLFVVNDSGLGLTNPDDPSMMDAVINEWGFGQFVPPSCAGCLQSGQLSSLIGWSLTHDPSLRAAAFSTYDDGIISGVFLGMTKKDFRSLMLQETDKLAEAHPQRFKRFFVEGAAHTAMLAGYYDSEVAGTSLLDWTDAMLTGDGAWQDLLE